MYNKNKQHKHWQATERNHMLLYHGSNVVVSELRLIQQNCFPDYGYGLNTTINQKQAIVFADKVYRLYKQ